MKYCVFLIRALVLMMPVMSPLMVAQNAPDQAATSVAVQPSSIRIGSGDLIDMTVFNVPEMSQHQRVDENGNYSVPLVGPVHLEGLTVQDAQKLIASKLDGGHYVREPSISLFISDFATQGASIMGEITKPGVYPVWGSRRLFDIIAAAGGVTARAGKIATISHRDNPDAPQSVAFRDGKAQDLDANPLIAPGDTIEVSKTGIVYVLGEVARPGGFPLENDQGLTLMKAVALAQGTTHTAKLGSARLVRNTVSGRKEIAVDLKSVMKGHSQDLILQADDILYVPNSFAKTLVERSLPGIVAATSTAVIYTEIR